MRLPNESGVEFLLLQPMVADRPPEHDRLGRRPDGRAELRADAGLPLPGRHDDLRARPDRGADRPGPAHQRADLALEPVGQQGHPRQPDRRAARRLADLPPAGLPAVDRLGVPRVPADRRRLAAPGRLGRDARRGARASCWRPRPADRPIPSPTPTPTPGPTPAPGPTPTPARRHPGTDAGHGAAGRRAGPHRLRQRPLRARPDGAPRRRLRPLRRRDRRSSRPPSSDSRSSLPGSASPARGRRPAPRHDPRGGRCSRRCSSRSRRPATWPLALAAFLVRGGIARVPAADRRPAHARRARHGLRADAAVRRVRLDPARGHRRGGARSGSSRWSGSWRVAGWPRRLEAEGARIVAGDEEVAVAAATPGSGGRRGVPRPDGGVAARILVARLIAAVPLGVALALGSIRLVLVTYRELTAPLDVATPLAIRVLRGTPEVVVAVVVTWMLAEIVGALAARRIALAATASATALDRHAVRVLVREPAVVARPLLASRRSSWSSSSCHRALAAASAWEAVGHGPGRAAPSRSRLLLTRRRVRRPVDRGTGAHRRRLRLASRRLDGRRGHAERGRSGGPLTADRVTGGCPARLRRCGPVGPRAVPTAR